MRSSAPPVGREDYAAMVRRFAPGARLIGLERLAGGSSAETMRLDLEYADGGLERLVSRRHGDIDHAHEPEVAAHEFRLLSHLHAAGLPVQRPRHVDREGPFRERPAVVLDYIEGRTITDPNDPVAMAEAIAAILAAFHRTDTDALQFLHRLDTGLADWLSVRVTEPDETMHETRLRHAMRTLTPPPCRPTLVHGDYWPGNILWSEGRVDNGVVAVIDWEDAAIGDPLADLAVARLDLLWSLGEAAMTAFSDRYHRITGISRNGQPYWDLFAALRAAGRLASWGFEGEAAARAQRAHEMFVETAFAKLEG